MRLEGIIDMTKCLLVDEDQEERQVLSQLLGQYGFDMSETASAEAALKLCRANSPDIVVTADRIGSMSAGEFVKRVRRAANGRKPVVLVYTEKANTDEIGSAIIEGAAEFLLKPFDRDLLEFKLKQVGLL
jgi:two-component system, chemotaxis family, chemotaxis protein CheY